MTKINFYSGLREIGGTFVEIETQKAKCMFDFGFAAIEYQDDKVKRRKDSIAADYVTLGMLTATDGIYDKKTAKKIGKKAYGEDEKQCFFVISHMHIDHMGGLGLLDPEIPVYMSTESYRLYRRLEANHDIQGSAHHKCIGVAFLESFTIEDITVKVLPIDHDIIGASGFLITTPDGSVCYTGDYRFHGFHPEVTEEFAKAAKGADVLITEGVSVSFLDVDMINLEKPTEQERTEYSLLEEIETLSKEKDGLIVINPYNRNVERLHHLIHTLKVTGRILVMDTVQADYVAEFYPEDEIYVYKEVVEEEALQAGVFPESWKLISREELLKEPHKYVLQNNYCDIYELIDLKEIISCYVHMDGTPLGDYDPSFEKLRKILEKMKVEVIYMGIGGHAKPYYLRYMIDRIEPRTLIPLHSFRPDQVISEKAGVRYLPQYGESFILK